MSATQHALDRASVRMGQTLNREAQVAIVKLAERAALQCGPRESIAVRLGRVRMVGTAWSDDSNGDTIVAIIRQGRVVTFMFRRSTQPFRPSNLSVDRCI